MKKLVTFYVPLINWPFDFQSRIHRNRPNILWEGAVHETLTGYNIFSHFPAEEGYCIVHPKKIEKQEKQNKFYEGIDR